MLRDEVALARLREAEEARQPEDLTSLDEMAELINKRRKAAGD